MDDVERSPYPPPFHFNRLPSSLFSLLTHSLPLPDKLLHLTRLCHTFPALSPACFAFDTLARTPTLIHLTTSPSPPLLSLLSRVSSALFIDHFSHLPSLCHLLSPALPSSLFPELRAVTFAPHWKGVESDSSPLPSPISGLHLCSHLTALDLSLSLDHLSLKPLTLLPSLRTLRFSTFLDTPQFLLLLSLPVTSLDLLHSAVHLSGPFPSSFPPSPLFTLSSCAGWSPTVTLPWPFSGSRRYCPRFSHRGWARGRRG